MTIQQPEGSGLRTCARAREDLDGDRRTVRIGWKVAGAMLVMGVVVAFLVIGTHMSRAQREAHPAPLPGSWPRIDPENYPLLKDSEITADQQALEYWRKKERLLHKERKEVQDVWDREIKADLPLLRSLTSEQMLKMLNVIRQDIAPNESKLTPSFGEGMKAARKDISRALVTKLHDEAKSQPLNAGNWKAAVQAYTRAEDEIFKIFDQAKTDQDKDMTELAKTHYEQVLMEFNKFAEQTFTVEFMAGMPARELIQPAEEKNWIAANLQGFEKRLSPGELVIVNESERTGIVSIGLQEHWRDFQLDVAYTVKKGDAELHVRHGPTRADPAQNPAFDLGPRGILPAPEGVEARFQLQLAGGRLVFRAPGCEPDERNVANKRRKGAIGIAVKPGSTIAIRQLTLRLVR